MLDVLNKFQNAALSFNPMMLVVPGMLCVVLGIIIWLAGTKFTRIIAMAVGFIGGVMSAFYLISVHQTSAAILGAVIGALLAFFIHRFIAIIVGVAVFAIVGLIVLSSHFDNKVTGSHYPNADAVPIKLSPTQTAEQIKSHLTTVTDQFFHLAKKLPLKAWPTFAVAVAALMVVGIFVRRLLVAFACSSLGTVLIFAGMFCLLLYKGSAPLTRVYERISFFSAVFASMVVAGMISQLILCRPLKLKILRDNEKEKNKLREKVKEIEKGNRGEYKWTAQ
jgi:hypothetical protein